MTATTPVASGRDRRGIPASIATLLVATALLGTIACSGTESSTGPKKNPSAVGIYALVQVNKKTVPFQIFRGPYYYAGVTFNDLSIQVTGGELILQDRGQFHLAVDFRFLAQGDQATTTRTFDGSYEVRGGDIVFTDGGGPVTGSLTNGYVLLFIDPAQTGDKQTYSFKYAP